MRRTNRGKYFGWWTLAILILLSALVPAAYFLKPHITRWQQLNALTSPDIQTREQALNYVIRRAPIDERVRQGAIQTLNIEDETNFLQIVNALDTAGLWQHNVVGDAPWQRWLEGLSKAEQNEARIMAGQLAADLVHLADDPWMVQLLERLVADADPDVRYNALISLGELIGSADNPASLLPLLHQLASDTTPTTARHAWIILGLLKPNSGFTADWQNADPQVAEAILWAALHTNPDAPTPAIEALRDPNVSSEVRAAAAYALHQSDHPEAIAALLETVTLAEDQPIADERLLPIWRAALALPQPDLNVRPYSPTTQKLAELASVETEGQWFDPVRLAATFRLGIAGVALPRDTPAFDLLVKLATVEGQLNSDLHWPIKTQHPDLLRVQTTAVSKSPNPEALRSALASSDARLRNLACVVAAERFTRDTLDELIKSLIIDLDDDAKMSGAILAGLTGKHIELLTKRAAAEDIWAVQTIQKLGLWMAGDDDALGTPPANLLARDDLPKTTILLAMLHRGEYSALDQLLNPRGEPGFDLIELFDTSRWWFVLSRYLPDSAPPFWVWGDPALEQFQIDVLRNWYLVNRQKLLKE